MVVVKQLDSKYPRLGYEVQKGLFVDMPLGDGQLATHLSDLLETVSDKSVATDETAKTPEINDSATMDMDVLFDELTSLKDRAKEKVLNATALQLSKMIM